MDAFDFDFDAPNFKDFTTLNTTEAECDDKWFDRRAGKETCSTYQEGDDSESHSPKKRRKTDDDTLHKKATPRRSPRLLDIQTKKPAELSSASGLKRSVSQPQVTNKKIPARVERKRIQPVRGKKIEPQASKQPEDLQSLRDTEIKEKLAAVRKRQQIAKAKAPLENTRPQPFKFSKARSTATLPTSEKYQSLAEAVANFHGKTPERFKSKADGPSSGGRSRTPQMTIPKSPALAARGRKRTVKALSQKEQEEAEFQHHHKQQFKANPINQKILAVPHVGVHKVTPKAPTVPQEFQLSHCNTRSHLMAQAGVEKEDRVFHANPLNKKILEGCVGVKDVESQPLTIPQSPAFTLPKRVRRPVQEPVVVETAAPVPKHHPVPHAGVPFRPKLLHPHTEPKPFSVEERSKQMLKKKEEKIMRVLEEEKKAREFTAQLLPSDEPDTLPPKQLRPITQPEPFKLQVDMRGQRYKDEWRHKIEEENKEAKAQAEFKARPNKVIFKQPFVPEKSSKALTEVGSFALNTDVRAEQREMYNQHLKAHEAEVNALKKLYEERRQQKLNADIVQLRRDMVHQANGIRRYKSLRIPTSHKPLTEPQSPHLRTQTLNRRTRHTP